jgi:hypothetical protein
VVWEPFQNIGPLWAEKAQAQNNGQVKKKKFPLVSQKYYYYLLQSFSHVSFYFANFLKEFEFNLYYWIN